MSADDASGALRASLAAARRIVVKIGSASLAAGAAAPRSRRKADRDDVFTRLAADVARVAGERKRQLCLVSSGAIALGVERLRLEHRPREMAGLQAAAAAGQGLLMQRYGDAFDRHGLAVAQVLLTHADLASRTRTNNARAALTRLLELGVVPVINENDAVAVDEIKLGDNDELAAMVAALCQAELLVLLSDVPGLLDARGRRLGLVARVDDAARAHVRRGASALGRGGMHSKLESARRATLAGAHVVIAPAAEPRVLERLLGGEDLGTLFPRVEPRLGTRKHWIAFTLRPRGAAVVDDGAAEAVLGRGRSVLCVGVVGVRGAFVDGDPISIVTIRGEEIARGLSRLSAADAARRAGMGAKDGDDSALLVHRDDLVLLPR
jgi:glutamate 5-kinase